MPGRKQSKRGRANKRGDSGPGISRENMYNEVDEFHEQRDRIMLKSAGVEDESSDDEIDVDGGNAAVFDLNAPGSSDSGSSSSSDSSSSSGDSDDEVDNHDVLPNKYNKEMNDLPDDKAWGKKKDFYGEDGSDDAQNSEDEDMVVEEAARLQREQMADVNNDDYGLSDDSSSSDDEDDSDDQEAGKKKKKKEKDTVSRKKSKKRKKKLPDEATALKEVNKTLDSIDFSASNDGVTTVEVIKSSNKGSNKFKNNQIAKDKKWKLF